MSTEVLWCLILCVFMVTVAAAAAVLVLSRLRERETLDDPAAWGWYLELWHIGRGYRVGIPFFNTAILGRISLTEYADCFPPPEPDGTVSREHGMLYEDSGTVLFWNLSAVNPAVLNGHRVNSPRPLVPGDRIELGNSVFLVTRLERTGQMGWYGR